MLLHRSEQGEEEGYNSHDHIHLPYIECNEEEERHSHWGDGLGRSQKKAESR